MREHFSGVAGRNCTKLEVKPIPLGQICFRISKSCPVSAQKLPTDGPMPKMG